MKSLFIVSFFLLNSLFCQGKVESRTFKTPYTAKDFIFPKKHKKFEPVFYRALKSAPESMIISLTLGLGANELGLKAEDTRQLMKTVPQIYQEISRDKTIKEVKSALPYIFSKDKKHGHYFIYTPEKEIKDTILFLHGYGGNFLFYIYALKEAFPDYRIVVPSYGVSWDRNGIFYLNNLLKSLEVVKDKNKLWLMALSGGGPLGFEYYRQKFNLFKGYACLASAPLSTQLKQINPKSNLLIINGRSDSPRHLARTKNSIEIIKADKKKVEDHYITGGHFFLMTNGQETFKLIKNFFKKFSDH